jgi:hypothetical protein
MDKMVITKVGDTPKVPVTVAKPVKGARHSPGHKTQKSIKGILKIRGVSDPAKAPPMKRAMKKHTLRILSDKGMTKHKKTLKRKISKLKDSELNSILEKSNLKLNESTPRGIKDKIVENAVSAGFVSLD